ncbi:MAG: hypothetical protein NTAFB01_36930 [Nitrospira sp.]
MSDTVVGAGIDWMLSIGGVLSSRVAGAVAVSSRGRAGVVEPIGGSVCCDGGSVAWARVGDNSSGIDVTVVFLNEVVGERLSGTDFGGISEWGFGVSEVRCSADGAT